MTTNFQYDFSVHKSSPFKGKVNFPTGVFINNKFSAGSSNKTIEVINPSTGKPLTQISEGTSEDVNRAVEAAEHAFDTVWGLNSNGSERGKLLIKLAELMEEHADELAALESLDNGKPYKFSRGFDIPEAAAIIRYFGGYADKLHGNTIDVGHLGDQLAYTRLEPIGICGQITPWNFPLFLIAFKLGPALAAGNAVVLKPSEVTPLTAARLCSLIIQAGFPPGAVNIVTGYGQTVGAALTDHPKIAKLAFTGSTAIGKLVLKASANTIKKTTLELGGKSPAIVFNDANLQNAIEGTAFGIWFNQSQCCCAGSRIFVQDKIYDKFVEGFKKHTETLKVGDPFEDVFFGPLVNKTQFERVNNLIDTGKRDAKLIECGQTPNTGGYFVKPHIFLDAPAESDIQRVEVFGPAVTITRFSDEANVIKMANDTEYGLAGSVFTESFNRAHKVAHQIKAGTIWINQHNNITRNVPFGGYKQSGIGRELGEDVLHNYTQVKSVFAKFT